MRAFIPLPTLIYFLVSCSGASPAIEQIPKPKADTSLTLPPSRLSAEEIFWSDTNFISLQGRWDLIRKYSPPGKSIYTKDSIFLLINKNVVSKWCADKILWTDTLFMYNSYDGVFEYYAKNDRRVGF